LLATAKMKSIVAVFATVLLLTAAAGAPTVRHSGGDKTIADIVAASGSDLDTDGGDFDILLKLATLANLVPALSDPSAMLTVFAPTDAAFVQTAKDLGLPGVTDEKSAFEGLSSALGMAGNVTDIVGQILKYHVSPSMLMSADVLKMTSIPTRRSSMTSPPASPTLSLSRPTSRHPTASSTSSTACCFPWTPVQPMEPPPPDQPRMMPAT
jgi:uncharacterized surface protein with fasciclin (FAS1) repeats